MEFQILITPHHTFVRKLVGLHTSHNPRQRSRERKRQREGWETREEGTQTQTGKKGERFDLTTPFAQISVSRRLLHLLTSPISIFFLEFSIPFPLASPTSIISLPFLFSFPFFFLPQFSGWISGGDYYFKVRFGFWAFSWSGFLLLFLFFLFSHNSVKLSCFGSEFRVGFMGLIQISIIWNTRVWFCLILCHMQPPSLNAHNLLDFIFNFWYLFVFFSWSQVHITSCWRFQRRFSSSL